MKPCISRIESELIKRIEILEQESKTLRHHYDNLSDSFRTLQKQMEESKMCPPLPPPDNSPDSPALDKVVSLSSLPYSVSVSEKKDVDIAYLYSIPLVKLSGRRYKPEALGNPIDAYKEMEALEKELNNSKKEVQLIVNTGNATTFMRSLEQRPKILHISCHGGYEGENEETKAYLYLEDSKEPGIMHKFDEEKVKHYFSPEKLAGQEIRPRLVFISACYSQKFGEIFREAGIPNVIAVNGYTQIADEAATGFASTFYHHLLNSKTVKEAFELAKSQEKLNNHNIRLCCCTHNHKPDCLWLSKIDEDHYAAHAMHEPTCNCEYGGNIHKRTCPWLKAICNEGFISKPVEGSPSLRRVCCCSPDIPHNEEEKFILLSRDTECANEKIFDFTPTGKPIVTKCFQENLVPRINDVLIGRNIEMQELVKLLARYPSKKIICVSGPPGSGKSLLIRTAAKYVMEREGIPGSGHENFPDGFASTTLNNTYYLLTQLNAALLPPPRKEARTLEELAKKISSLRELVVIECENVMENNAAELVKKLREILKEGVKVKFILTSKKKVPAELQIDGEVVLKEDLDMISVYNIIKLRYPEWPMSYLDFSKSILATKIKTPWLVNRVAALLKESSIEDAHMELCNKNVISMNEGNKEENASYSNLIARVLEEIEGRCKTLSPIFLLAQLNSGAFESTFAELIKDNAEDYKLKLDAYISENKSVAMVTKIKVEETAEFRYKVCEDMINYINSTYLDSYKKASYKFFCLEKLAHISRHLVRSYNVSHHKGDQYDEFSAIIDDGIWSCFERFSEDKPFCKNPIPWFQCEKDNITTFLDPKTLPEIAENISESDTGKLLDCIKELALCTFTLLLLPGFGRPGEAIEIVDIIQGFARIEDYGPTFSHTPIQRKYLELRGTMTLIKASIVLKDSEQLKVDEAMKDAEDAEKLFCMAGNHMGAGEVQYLRGLLLAKYTENFNDCKFTYNSARDSFRKAKYKLGEVRVSIAEAILLLKNKITDNVAELLEGAMKTLNDYNHLGNMLTICYFYRAKYYKQLKKYELAKQDLDVALERFEKRNEYYANRCSEQLRDIAELMQQDCPLFAFLKAFPMVKTPSTNDLNFMPLEPNVRQASYFRPLLNDCFKLVYKCIKVHFDTLTLANLKKVFSRSCALLHLSSDHYTEGSISLEGQLGNLEQIPLEGLQNMLEHAISTSKCKVVVVAIPQGEDIAQMFVNLGIPHVIYFDFSNGGFDEYEDRVDIRGVKYESIYKFCIDFYKNLLDNSSVYDAWQCAKFAMEEFVKSKGDTLGIKFFHFCIDPGPVLLPRINGDMDPTHNVVIFPNLKRGEYVETSPERAQCNIEKSRAPFVGRQVDMYRIVRNLRDKQCVNLYGEYGVGKTRLAKEVGYFLYVRLVFQSSIHYFENLAKGESFKSALASKLQCSSHRTDNLPTLIILDNMSRDLWQRERYYFMSLKNDRNCVFLFVSHGPLEASKPEGNMDFPMVKHELKPLEDRELCLDYVFAMLEAAKHPLNPVVLGIEKHNRKALRNTMASTKGFRQANGYPKLLSIFCEKILDSQDLWQIDMMNDHSIEPRFRKIMRHIDREDPLRNLNRAQTGEMPNERRRSDSFQGPTVLERGRAGEGRMSMYPVVNQNSLRLSMMNSTPASPPCLPNPMTDLKENEDEIYLDSSNEFEEDKLSILPQVPDLIPPEIAEYPAHNSILDESKSDSSDESSHESKEDGSPLRPDYEESSSDAAFTSNLHEIDEGETSIMFRDVSVSEQKHQLSVSMGLSINENDKNSPLQRILAKAKSESKKQPKQKPKKELKKEKKPKDKKNFDKEETKKPEKSNQKKGLGKSGKNARKYKKNTIKKYYKYKEKQKEPEESKDDKESEEENANAVVSEISSESEMEDDE